jgi:hypothetical protein
MSELPLARKMWRTLEAYHALPYFTPATGAYREIGLTGRDAYFAARSAGLGPVPAEVVIATFYNFHPDLVRRSIDSAWSVTTPAAAAAARVRVADEGLRAIFGDDLAKDPAVAEALELARVAAEAAEATMAGRPLYAAHVALPWPDEPHLALWHAITLVREHRGDGHIAALVLAGLDPCEALVTHEASGEAALAGILQSSRAWPDDEWKAAIGRLAARGLVEADGSFTPEGRALRDEVEARTDAAATAPWTALGQDGCDRLRTLVRPFSRGIAQSGVLTSNPLG